ncbi:AMP-binding protein [Nocardia terpenica]|uniref:AMP-binding protein n=1 Tax=Nocardia terpenica TaxID=455432 RepID=A0A6G9Z1S6_9NOCA|nr:AMP-binding protein [Nocardia terpenica]
MGAPRWPRIDKSAAEVAAANLTDYERSCREFHWEDAQFDLAGLPDGGVNIAFEAVDRHLTEPGSQVPSLRWLSAAGGGGTASCAGLAVLGNRFADLLHGRGVRRGHRVCTLLPPCLEMYAVALGTWKAGCVLVPLDSRADAESVHLALVFAEAAMLVTSAACYRELVAPIRAILPGLRQVLIIDACLPDTVELPLALAGTDPACTIVPTSAGDPALLHVVSDRFEIPQGIAHAHGAVLAHRVTARYALDLRAGDVFWCTGDPSSVLGMSYGVIAAMSLGATVICDEADFAAQRCYDILTAERVTVWCTDAASLHALMRAGDRLPPGTDLSCLRLVVTGEPVDPEVVLWADRVLGKPVHAGWCRPETGAIVIADLAAAQLRPGSMGRPLPGIEATVLRLGGDGRAEIRSGATTPAAPGEVGELALHAGWPSMFRGYWREPTRYARAFARGWYLTGDLVRRDDDGYYWFVRSAEPEPGDRLAAADALRSGGLDAGPM